VRAPAAIKVLERDSDDTDHTDEDEMKPVLTPARMGTVQRPNPKQATPQATSTPSTRSAQRATVRAGRPVSIVMPEQEEEEQPALDNQEDGDEQPAQRQAPRSAKKQSTMLNVSQATPKKSNRKTTRSPSPATHNGEDEDDSQEQKPSQQKHNNNNNNNAKKSPNARVAMNRAEDEVAEDESNSRNDDDNTQADNDESKPTSNSVRVDAVVAPLRLAQLSFHNYDPVQDTHM
jgi:hypothetical protein